MSIDAVKKVLLDIPSGRVAETFAQWDLNGDGLVTTEEFFVGAVHLDRPTAVAFFEVADRSHDGALDLGEFEAFAEMLHQARDLGVEFGTVVDQEHRVLTLVSEDDWRHPVFRAAAGQGAMRSGVTWPKIGRRRQEGVCVRRCLMRQLKKR